MPGRGPAVSRTAISRETLPQPARAREACQIPAAGEATSAYQKYGGPPWRSLDFAATLPSGATSVSSPANGFSVVRMPRSGAPFQGASGEGSTAISASSQPVWAWAEATVKGSSNNAPATSREAVTAAADRRPSNTCIPHIFLDKSSSTATQQSLRWKRGRIHGHGRGEEIPDRRAGVSGDEGALPRVTEGAGEVRGVSYSCFRHGRACPGHHRLS